MAESTRVRRARKYHPCLGGCSGVIKPGEMYLAGIEFPGGDLGLADYAGHPVRLAECRRCAERYGRGDRFDLAEVARG